MLYQKDPGWAESKSTLVIGIFLTWAITNDIYKTLIKGYPLDILFDFGKGTFWNVVSLLISCGLLYMTLSAIHDHSRRVHPLKLFPLLVQAFWAGSIMLYLFVLMAFYLDFFLINVSRFE